MICRSCNNLESRPQRRATGSMSVSIPPQISKLIDCLNTELERVGVCRGEGGESERDGERREKGGQRWRGGEGSEFY